MAASEPVRILENPKEPSPQEYAKSFGSLRILQAHKEPFSIFKVPYGEILRRSRDETHVWQLQNPSVPLRTIKYRQEYLRRFRSS